MDANMVDLNGPKDDSGVTIRILGFVLWPCFSDVNIWILDLDLDDTGPLFF